MTVADRIFNYGGLRFFDRGGSEIMLKKDSSIVIATTYDDDRKMSGECLTDRDGSVFVSEVTEWGMIDPDIFPSEVGSDDSLSFELGYSDASGSYSAYTDIPIREMNIVPVRALYGNVDVGYMGIESILRTSPLDVSGGWTDASGNSVDVSLPFPSQTVSGDIYFERCSVGLVETQTLIFGGVSLSSNASGTVSYENLTGIEGSPDYSILFYIDGRQQDDFRFFDVSSGESVVTWSDRRQVVFDGSVKSVNIGFDASVEGTYEEPVQMFIVYNNGVDDPAFYYYGSIMMHAIAEGEDERYRTLFTDFGLGDPKDYYDVFRDRDGREGNVDFRLLNEKSKELFLSYDSIFPYLGTYKALLNAVRYLGYDDIYFKEWFRDVTDSSASRGTYVTYDVAYGSEMLRSTITSVPIEKRISYRKMNWLTMVYKINEESGEYDKYGFPITRDVVDYDSDILVRLMSLKMWLERYVISLNCRIVDITGDGIYYVRYSLDAYPNSVRTLEWKNVMPIAPETYNDLSKTELVDGSAHILLGFGQVGDHISLDDIKDYSLEDFVDDRYIVRSTGDVSARTDDDDGYVSMVDSGKYIPFGGTAMFPYDYGAVSFSLNVSNRSALIGPPYCDSSLWINDDEIIFPPEYYGNSISEGAFSNDINLSIHVRSGVVRTFDEKWGKSVAYDIGYADDASDGSPHGYYIRSRSSADSSMFLSDSIVFRANDGSIDGIACSPLFRYTEDNAYGVPLFLMRDFRISNFDAVDGSFFSVGKDYILEMTDGTIFFDNSIGKDSSFALVTTSIDFRYDASLDSDVIDVNNRFVTKRMPFSNVSFTKGFAAEYLVDPDVAIEYHDSVAAPYDISVFRTGQYGVLSYIYDRYNNMFCNMCDSSILVYMKEPVVSIITRERRSNADWFYDGSILYSATGSLAVHNIMNMFNDISVGNDLSDSSASDDGPDYMQDYMGRAYSAAFPICRPRYISSGIEFHRDPVSDDAVDADTSAYAGTYMYATYPRIGYSADLPVDGGTSDFINIADRFFIVSMTDDSFTLSRRTYGFFNKFFDTGSPDSSYGCNVVLYSRVLNARVFESHAYLSVDGDGLYTIGFGNDAAMAVKFRSLSSNKNNSIYLQDISEFEVAFDSSSTDSYVDSDGDDVFDVSIKGYSSICGGKPPYESGEMVRIRMVKGGHSGCASYKVKGFDAARSMLVLYGGFNYSAGMNGIYISHAHHAFVDYPAYTSAVVVEDGSVRVYFPDGYDDAVFNSLDDTFSICPERFDINSMVSDWMPSDSSMFLQNMDEIGTMGFFSADEGSRIRTTRYILPEIVQTYIERRVKHHVYVKWDDPYWFEDLTPEEQGGATESTMDRYPHIKPSLDASDASAYAAASNSDSIRTRYRMVEKDSFWPRYHVMDESTGLGEDYVYTKGTTSDSVAYYSMYPLYSYYSPITVSSGADIIVDADFYRSDSSYAVDASYLRLSGQKHVFWNIWKEDRDSSSRTLRGNLYNRYLFLAPSETGIYDIDGYVYDDYGNLASSLCYGRLMVV